MLLIKACLFGFSNLGYWEFFRKKTGMNVYFLPIFTIASQFCMLFVGGLLNILLEMSWVVYILGLALFGYGLWTEKKQFWKPYCNWGYAFLLLGLVLVYIHVKDAVFTHIDNFSHWSLVVKKLLEVDRFPNFMDTKLGYPYYPLGSSTYIYYFCKMIGSAEYLQMMAQSLMMMVAILPLFAFAKKRPVMIGLFLTSITIMIFGYAIRVTELLVDTLLPLVGMAGVLYMLFTFGVEDSHTKDSKYAIWMAAPFLIWPAQIKNSGLLFSFLAIAVMVWYLRKDFRNIWQKLLVSVSPLLSVFLWRSHCTDAFPPNAQEKHAMTAMNYLETFSEKNMENASSIAVRIVQYMTSREGFYWILIWLAVLGIMTLLLLRENRKYYIFLFSGVTAIHVIYMIGVIGMYLFSMPVDEAMELASIERYVRTLDVAAYYLLALYSVTLISGNIWKWGGESLIGAVLVVLCFTTLKLVPDSRPWMTLEHRLLLENKIQNYGIEKNQSYFICIPEYDNINNFKFLCNYLLDELPYTQVVTEKDQLEEAENYDVFINLDEDNPIIQEWIAGNHIEAIGETVIFFNN